MSVSEILTIVGAVTVSVTTVISAVGTVWIAIRQAGMKQTANETRFMVNSHNDALRALIQKQGLEMHLGGLPPTIDDSLKEGPNG